MGQKPIPHKTETTLEISQDLLCCSSARTSVCCVTVSGQAGPWSPAPHRTLSLASDAASSGHPRSRRLTQDTYRVFSAEIRLDTDIIAVIKGTLGTQRCDLLTICPLCFMEMHATCLKTSYLESKFLCCYFYYDSNARTDTAGIDREWVERGAERGKRDRITVTQSLKIGDTLELIRWCGCDMLLNPSA